MKTSLELEILRQPDDTTCGPTCLHAIYRYYGLQLSLAELIESVPQLDEGGTLAVMLGCDALQRGFQATILTYNLNIFDPTWFAPGVDLPERLRRQAEFKRWEKLQLATQAYLEFLTLGGQIRMEDLNHGLLLRYLDRCVPILTGLTSTFLYSCARERPYDNQSDDIHGFPAGHFVVICGYDSQRQTASVADPYLANPLRGQHYYEVTLDRLIGAVLLGVLTYDANLLIIQPADKDDLCPS
jgi:hypothetical protein